MKVTYWDANQFRFTTIGGEGLIQALQLIRDPYILAPMNDGARSKVQIARCTSAYDNNKQWRHSSVPSFDRWSRQSNAG